MLYQKDKHGASGRFLKQGCVLGREAVRLWKRCQLEGEDAREDDEELKEGERDGEKGVWQSLADGMGKRWELLGVCYSKIGDRKVSVVGFSFSFQLHAHCYPLRVAHYSWHTTPLSNVSSPLRPTTPF